MPTQRWIDHGPMETNDDGAGRFAPAPTMVTNPIRRAFRLQQDQHRLPSAFSASAATALAVLIGWLAGDVTAGLLAVTGSLTALYGVGRPYLDRGVHLAVIGVCFAVAVALGDWAAGENPWLGVLTVALIAMGAVLLCNAFAAGPGAYLFVLGCAAATSAAPEHLSPFYLGLLVLGGSALGWLAQMAGALVSPRGPERVAVARSGDAVDRYIHAVGSVDEASTRQRAAQSLYDSWYTLVTLQPAGAAQAVRRLRRINYELHSLFAEAMAAASRPATSFETIEFADRLRAVRGSGAETESVGIENTVVGNAGPIDRLRQAVTLGSAELWVAGRVGIAVLLAGLTGEALELDRSYWAMAAAALMLHQGLDWIRTLQRGFERLLGTQAGLLLAAAVLAFHPHGLVLVLVLGLLQFLTVMFTVPSYAISVVFTTGMALVIDSGIGSVDVGALLLDRGSETLLGCLVALAVYLVTARLDRRSGLPEAIALTLDAVASTLPYLATESVTTTDARIARRDLHFRATNLLPVYEAAVLGVGRQRGFAESMWPAVAAAEELAHRTSAECWSVECVDSPRQSGKVVHWTLPELNDSSAILGQLSAAFRAARPSGDGTSAVPFMAAETAVMDRVARAMFVR